MNPQTMGTVFLGVALLVGSFAGGFALLDKPRADPEEAVLSPAQSKDGPKAAAASEGKAEPVRPQAADPVPQQAPVAREDPEKPLTRGEVGELGEDCIGRRVSWACQHILTTGSESDRGHTQHFFFAEGPPGKFYSLVVAQEPEPLGQSPGSSVIKDALHRSAVDRHQRIQDRKRRQERLSKEKNRQQKEEYWKRHPIIVTGTIAGLENVFLVGYGQHSRVPVLKNITITAK